MNTAWGRVEDVMAGIAGFRQGQVNTAWGRVEDVVAGNVGSRQGAGEHTVGWG